MNVVKKYVIRLTAEEAEALVRILRDMDAASLSLDEHKVLNELVNRIVSA